MQVRISASLRNTFLMVLVTVLCPALQAQPTNRNLCFRDSGPGCRTFLVTEAGILHILNKELFDAHINVELGALHKINKRWACGGSLNMIYDEDGSEAFLLAAKPRIRHWFNKHIHSDLSLGVIFLQISGDHDYLKLPDLTGTLSVSYRDWVSVVLQLEALRFRYPQSYSPLLEPKPPDLHVTDTNWYLGVNFGSIPGAILLPLVTAGAIFVEYADDHWD